MNNNYHTQIEQKNNPKQNNNLLNEIAANNKLLQVDDKNQLNQQLLQQQQLQLLQSMQNFQGTPINKTQMPQLTPQQQQMLYMQQLAAQQQAQQAQLQAKQAEPDEIELSEQKPEKVEAPPLPKIIPPPSEPAKRLAQRPPMPALPQYKAPPQPATTTPSVAEKNSGSSMDFVLMPIILLITFVALVHPKTSGILERYLPKLDSMKGYLVRGVILVIIYLIASFLMSGSKKN